MEDLVIKDATAFASTSVHDRILTITATNAYRILEFLAQWNAIIRVTSIRINSEKEFVLKITLL